MVAPHFIPSRPPKMKAHIDITPILVTATGDFIELGMVRYEVEAAWFKLPSSHFECRTQRVPLDYESRAMMEFAVRVSSADKPQPQRIDSVSAYPKESYGPPHAEMAAPKWTDAQGHPVDQYGVRIEPADKIRRNAEYGLGGTGI